MLEIGDCKTKKKKRIAQRITSERMRAWGPGGKAPWQVKGRALAGSGAEPHEGA